MRSKRRKIYIEASAITEAHPSGIGHMVIALIRELSTSQDFNDKYQIILLVARDRKNTIARWNFPTETVDVKSIWLEKHVLQVLLKRRLLPPMDVLIGKGLYIFPNYKNWPLMFSRSITFIYDVAFAIFPETVQPKNLFMLERNVPIWMSRTDRVVTISKNSKNEINKYFKVANSKIDIVYCAVDTKEYFKHSNDDVDEVRKKYDIPEKYILFIGNIEPRKNLLKLLEAYSMLPDNLKTKFALVIIGGDGWLNDAIFRKIDSLLAAGLNVIHPERYVEDREVSALYSGASLLVLPAIHEGFGLPLIEAMASSTPVITSNISAMPEVAGDAAIYFSPDSASSIAKAIEKVLLNKEIANKIVSEGSSVVQKFSWANSAKQLIESIEKVENVR